MKRRWRVAGYDAMGRPLTPIAETFTRRGAERHEQKWRKVGREMGFPTGIPEPIPGMPMYTIRIEQIA